jgi:hypothetical protein
MQIRRAESPQLSSRPHPRAAGFALVDSYRDNLALQD